MQNVRAQACFVYLRKLPAPRGSACDLGAAVHRSVGWQLAAACLLACLLACVVSRTVFLLLLRLRASYK